MILYPNRKTVMTAAAALAAFITLTDGGAADAGKSPYTRARPNAVLFGTVAAPTKAPLNINAAGKPELGPLPVLSSAAKAAILNFKAGGPYVDGTDFATRVCSRVAVDFGPTDIKIGGTLYTGFKCPVPAGGTYTANGGSHAYPIAVEVTGSATVPPAPPAQ